VDGAEGCSFGGCEGDGLAAEAVDGDGYGRPVGGGGGGGFVCGGVFHRGSDAAYATDVAG
jgi:hypothetical protein